MACVLGREPQAELFSSRVLTGEITPEGGNRRSLSDPICNPEKLSNIHPCMVFDVIQFTDVTLTAEGAVDSEMHLKM